MELVNFFTWFIFIAVIVGLGFGIMSNAYIGSGSVFILFKEPVKAPASLPSSDEGNKVASDFQQGYDAYLSGNYRQAVDKFNAAIQQVSTLAEAYHNRGLALANLRQDADAARDIAQAGELYLQQGNLEAIATIKANLEALKARKKARETGK